MLGLRLRDEFLTDSLPTTAVAFHREDKTGALDLSSEDFFKITYPSLDLQDALITLGRLRNDGRPVVLLGKRGRGKSHLVAAMHHCIGYLAHPFATLPTSPSPPTFAWHVKLKRVKSKDVLLALPEKKPQTYEKHRRLLGERA